MDDDMKDQQPDNTTGSCALEVAAQSDVAAGERHTALPLSAALYSSFLCILFGGNNVAIKLCVTGLGPFTTAGLRFALGGVALLIFAFFSGRPLLLNRRQMVLLLPVPVIFFFQLSLFYLGQSLTRASHGALLSSLLPFGVMLLAHFCIAGERITLRKICGLLLGFAAVPLLFVDSAKMGEGVSLVGDIMVLCSVFFWACNTVYVKKIIHQFDIFQVTLYPMLVAAPLFLLSGWFFDAVMVSTLNLVILGALAFQALITAAYGFVAWNSLLSRYGATSLNAFIFIIPVSGVLLGVVLLGEPFTFNILGAIILVVVSLLVVNGAKPKTLKRS